METTYDAPEDDPHKGAMLEICEIQVKGFVINCVSHLINFFKELRTSISYITQAINNFLIPPPRQKKARKTNRIYKLEYVQLQAIAKSPEGFPFATPITTFSVEISQA